MGEAIAAIEDGKRVGPRRKLEEALRLDPRHVEARAAMLRLSAGAIADGAEPRADPPAAAIRRGARARGRLGRPRARSPRSWRPDELEARLAAVPPRHPLGPDAVRLRVQGRLASGDPALVKDADRLANEHLGHRSDPSSILLLAETAAAVGDPAAVLKTLSELLDAARPAARLESRVRLPRARSGPRDARRRSGAVLAAHQHAAAARRQRAARRASQRRDRTSATRCAGRGRGPRTESRAARKGGPAGSNSRTWASGPGANARPRCRAGRSRPPAAATSHRAPA